MVRMEAHAQATGAEVIPDHIAAARPRRSGRSPAIGDGGTVYTADAVILATGAQAKWLGLPSEERFKGFGVSACATCDGFFYRGREVVVIGGGNTAVEEALFLTNFATKVTLVHRRDELRAEKILQDRLFRHPKIEMIWHHALDEVLGETRPAGRDRRAAARRRAPAPSGRSPLRRRLRRHRPRAGVGAGRGPARAAPRRLRGDASPARPRPAIPGVFAAGDIADPIYRQAVTSAGMGCMAALDAERFLRRREDAEAPETRRRGEPRRVAAPSRERR